MSCVLSTLCEYPPIHGKLMKGNMRIHHGNSPFFQSQKFGESGGTMNFWHLTWLKINNQFSGSSLR